MNILKKINRLEQNNNIPTKPEKKSFIITENI